MGNNRHKPLVDPHDPAISARNRRMAAWLCGGMFVVYNGFFAAVTALGPAPAANARQSFNYIKGNCFGIGEPVPGKAGYEMSVPLKTATCLLTTAGSPGIALGGLAANKKLSPGP